MTIPNRLLFIGNDGLLYDTNGFADGTAQLADGTTSTPPFLSDPVYGYVSAAVLGTTTYFIMADATDTTSAIWSYNGSTLSQITSSGSVVYNQPDYNSTVTPYPISTYNNDLVFSQAPFGGNPTFAIYNPTTNTILQPSTPNGGYDPQDFTTLNGALYFEALDTSTNAEAIYSYNGTTVTEVYNLHPTYTFNVGFNETVAAAGSVAGGLIAFNGHLYFGSGQQTVEELNSTSANSNSATNVGGAAQYNYSGSPGDDLIVANNHLFFLSNNNGIYSLSTSNGLTQVLGSIGAQSFIPVAYNGAVYFAANDPDSEQARLYTSTGGAATVIATNASLAAPVVFNGTLYYDNGSGNTLGTIDGTTVGTLSVPNNVGGTPLLVVPYDEPTWPANVAPPAPTNLTLDPGSDSGVQGDDITNVALPTIDGNAAAGTTVDIYDGATLIGTGTADSSGAFSIAVSTALTSGANSITATATSSGGMVSPASTALPVTLDQTQPDAPTALGLDPASDSGTIGDGLTNVAEPAIDGTGTPGDTILLYDGTNPTPIGTATVDSNGNWSVTPTAPLADGPHGLTATQTSPAGNVSTVSDTLFFTIDTSVPDAPSAPSLAAVSDSGVSGDDLTNVVQPNIVGTGSPGDTVTLYDGTSVTPIGTATVADDGSWSITPEAPLTDGLHDLTVTQTNAAGTASAPSAALPLTIDTAVPLTPGGLTLAMASDSGTTGDNLTNVSQPIILGNGTPGDTVFLYDGTNPTPIGTATVGPDSTWSITPTTPLTDGLHDLTATQTDAAGNLSFVSPALPLSIDTSIPTTPAALTLAPTSDSGVPGDDLTNATSPAITGTGTAGDTVTLYDGTSAIGTTTVASDGTWSVTPADPLTDGLHDLTATQTNAAGTPSAASAILPLTIDTSTPGAPAALTLAPASDSGVPGDDLTNVALPAITGTGTAGDTITLYDGTDPTPIGTATVGVDDSWSITLSTPLTDGLHDLTATQTSPAGNISAPSSTLPLTIDTTVPLTPGGLTLSFVSDSGTTGDNLTNVSQPTILGNGTPGDTVFLYDGTNPTPIGTATVGPDSTWSITPTTPLTDGLHDLTATQTDAAGNLSFVSPALPLSIDTSIPTTPAALTLAPISDSGVPGDDLTNATSPAITGTGTAGDTVTLYDGTSAIGTTTVAADGTWSVTPADPLTDGLHDLTATQTNLAGTPSASSAILPVTIDTAAPPALGPLSLAPASDSGELGDNLTNVATPAITGTGTAGDTVTLYDGTSTTPIGTATVGVDGTWSITPATPLADGVHDLTATQTSPAGNVSLTSPTLALTIDTSIPAAPGTPNLIPFSDSGVPGDDLTNVTNPVITGTGTAGDTLTLYDGTSIIGTATVSPDGSWAIIPSSSPLTNGLHDLTATQTSPAGNVSAASPTLPLTIDTSIPATPGLLTLALASDTGTTGDDLTSIASPAIIGTGTAGDTVTLYDGTSTTPIGTATVAADGTWSITPTTPLTDGLHDLTATQTSPAGNISAASATLPLTIDTSVPAVPAALTLAPASDSGLPGDDLTNVASPAITGTGTAGDTVTLYDGTSTTPIGTATVGVDGTWSVTPTAPLADGLHDITATQTNAAGTASAPSPILALSIDTTVPAAPGLPSLAPTSDSGVPGDDLTNVASPAIAGTGIAGDTVALYDGTSTTPIGTATVAADGTWSITPTTALGNGLHDLTATQTNPAGTVSTVSPVLALTIDTTVPASPTALTLAPASDSGVAGDDLTNATQPAITGTGTAGDTVTLYDGTGITPIGTATVAEDGTWSITPTTPLADGLHDLTASQTSPAGNISARSDSLALRIDTANPAAPTALALAPSSDSGLPGDGLTNVATPAITGTGMAGDTVTLYDGTSTTPIGTATVAADGTWSITPTAPFADGLHELTATQTSLAGNVSAASTALAVTIDTATPATPGLLTLAPASDSGVPGDDLTNVALPAITGTGTAGDTVTLYDGTSTTPIGTTTVAVDGTWSLTPTAPLANGLHDLTATQADAAGNVSAVSAPLALTIDTAAPLPPSALTLAPASDSGVAGDDLTNVTTPAITGTGTAGDTVTLYDGTSTTPIGTATVASDGTWSITPTAPLASGLHDLDATQTSPAGNVSTVSPVLALTIDTATPSTPAALTLAPASDSGTPGDDLTNVAQPAITGTGTVGDTVTLYDGTSTTPIGTATVTADGTWSITPGTVLANGVHQFTATQTSLAGNVSATSAALAVTIDATVPPPPAALTLAPASDSGVVGDDLTDVTQPAITGTGTAGDTVLLYDGTNTTPIGTATVDTDGTWSITPETVLPDGLHSLTAKQVDPAGSASAASTALALTIDTTVPAAPAALTLAPSSDSGVAGDDLTNVTSPAITGTGTAGDTVTLYDGTSTTPIGTATVAADGTWSITAAAALADGLHELTATQTSPAGNVSTASSALAVTIDTSSPAAPSAPTLDPASDTGTLGDDRTGVTTPVITGTGTAGDTVALYDGVDTTPIGTATVAADGTWSITPQTALTDGVHNLTAKQISLAGNSSAASPATALTIDTTVVTNTIFDLDPDADTLAMGIVAPTNPDFTSDQLAITVTALPSDGMVTLADGTPVTTGQSLTSAQLTSLLFTPGAGQSNVSSAFVYDVTDPNNITSTGRVTFAIGVTAPQITTGSQIPNTPTPSIGGTALPGSTVTLLSNGVAVGAGVANAQSGDYTITTQDPLPLGLNRLTTTVTLPDGQTTASAPLVVFDVQSPVEGTSTTDFSSADIGSAMAAGAQLAFVSGTEAVQLTDATLSVGEDTGEATIQRLYEGLLGRSNDTGGISYYDGQLLDGTSKASVAAQIMGSNEYIADHGDQTDQQFVDSLYNGLLGRSASDDPGSSFWMTQLADGASRADVAVAIADSAESKTALASTTAQVYVPHAAGTLAHELYETGLGREVELSALANFQSTYNDLTPAAFANSIANSQEFTALHGAQSNVDYVNSLYEMGLGRPADASGSAFWTGLLNSGAASRGDVLLGIATSADAAAHLTQNLSA